MRNRTSCSSKRASRSRSGRLTQPSSGSSCQSVVASRKRQNASGTKRRTPASSTPSRTSSSRRTGPRIAAARAAASPPRKVSRARVACPSRGRQVYGVEMPVDSTLTRARDEARQRTGDEQERNRLWWETLPMTYVGWEDAEPRAHGAGGVPRGRRAVPARQSVARERLRLRAHAGERVLEIGCGAGSASCLFARAGAAMTAIDLTDQAWSSRGERALAGARRGRAPHGRRAARLCRRELRLRVLVGRDPPQPRHRVDHRRDRARAPARRTRSRDGLQPPQRPLLPLWPVLAVRARQGLLRARHGERARASSPTASISVTSARRSCPRRFAARGSTPSASR